jgi:chemosensory pili system protein ChpA (sensor histidine kinase/response regulator)
MRNLLRQVDREFKRLVEQGVDGMNQAAPDELVKNLLFYVAKASDQTPKVRAVKDEYRLDDALPGAAVVDEERARLAGPDRGAMRSVVARSARSWCGSRTASTSSCAATAPRWASCRPGDAAQTDRRYPGGAGLRPAAQGHPRPDRCGRRLASGQREPSDAVLMDVAGALLVRRSDPGRHGRSRARSRAAKKTVCRPPMSSRSTRW